MNKASNIQARPSRAGRTGRHSRKRRRRFKVLAVLMSLLIAALICEVVLRVVLGAPLAQKRPVLHIEANPHRGWQMQPNTTHYAYHHPVRVNNLGLRGADIGDKQTEEVRILALGDSMIYGQGIADDQTLPVHLQTRLQDTTTDVGQTFTVVNGGLRSYSTNQELGLLKELGPTIRPDVVIIFWYWNDLMEHSIAEHHHRFTLTGPVAFDTKSKLEGWTLTKWRIAQVLRRSALLMWLHDAAGALKSQPITPAQGNAALVRLDGYLNQFNQLADQHGFKLFLAVIPDPNSLKDEHPATDYTLLVQAMAQKHGIPSLDLFDDASNAYDGGVRLPVVPYDGHYLGTVNESMARGVAKFLIRQLNGDWPKAKW